MTPKLTAKLFRARAAVQRAQADALPWEPAEFGTRETKHAKALRVEAEVLEESAAFTEAEDRHSSEWLKSAIREADAMAHDVPFDKWLDAPCRFSGNGHEGCFVAPVNRHGGPCVSCWARARQRMHEQKAEIAKLRGKP